jgi:hypothetical protein
MAELRMQLLFALPEALHRLIVIFGSRLDLLLNSLEFLSSTFLRELRFP